MTEWVARWAAFFIGTIAWATGSRAQRLIAGIALAAAVQAQDAVGDWQGALQVGQRELRLVFKISKEASGAMKTVVYSIDQGGQPMSTSATTLSGDALKVTIPGVGGSYEGKLAADGGSINGNWNQGQALPLILKKVTPETAWEIPKPPAPMKPMAADARLVFEVATIKPSRPEAQEQAITVRGQQFITRNTPLLALMAFAYNLQPKQIVGAQGWMETDRYDITAKPEAEGTPNDKQLKAMLKNLIVERFKLTFHTEKRMQSVFLIVPAKGGVKMTESAAPPNSLPGMGFRGLGELVGRNVSIPDFAGLMQSMVLDRPVMDQSELGGRYDFTLSWTPDEGQFGGRAPKPSATSDKPDLFRAMQEQMGLKMEATKAMADVLVIDQVAKPTEN